ncbi:uncharacterized protein LOC109847259 isoform X2 [Asparagus officinalis]|uniref:uncharacterized protein LOC109847259 isoform X2 n=1 Tax=Asparagus officinalis TaxID=4686 RepID=UPI00098E706F|nr:uncharacterized protein LOC109847259 isoform X2 [Asparagus officinalis]
MYGEFREKGRSRSRSGERKEIVDPDSEAVDRAQLGANGQLRKQINLSKRTLDSIPGSRVPVEEYSSGLDFGRVSSRKASRTIKTLIDKEISKEMQMRRSSPSVVARLMGLDTLPSVLTGQHKERGISSKKTSSVGFHRKHTSHECYPLQSNNEHQECKDVFEVMEVPKTEKQKHKPLSKGASSLEQGEFDLRPSDIELAFVKQKFMDADHSSTDDEFQYYKEYNDALEDLDPNSDLLVKYLREPNSLFRKHLQDLKCSPPSPHARHITILKPSRVAKSDNESCCRSQTYTERHTHLLKDGVKSFKKPVSNLVNHSIKEHNCSLQHKLSEPLCTGKTKGHFQSTPIVVLKPSLERAQDIIKTVPSARSPDNYPYRLIRQKRVPISGESEFCGDRERHKLSASMVVMGHKSKGLREIARDVTKQLRHAGNSGKVVADSKKRRSVRDENPRNRSGMENLKSEPNIWFYNELNECGDSLSASSYYATESSVSREARKRLSERLDSIKQIHKVGLVDKGSSTLGEMLVSDREIPGTTQNASIIQNVSGEKVLGDEILARREYPMGIGSKDDWRDGWSRNLSRSKSLPTSSFVYGDHKSNRKNRVGISDSSHLQNVLNKSRNDSFDTNVSQRTRPSTERLSYRHDASQSFSGREESEIFDREIHVNSEQLHDKFHVTHTGEEVYCFPELTDNYVAGRAPQCKDATFDIAVDNEQALQSTKLEVQANDGKISGPDLNYTGRKETSVDHPQVSSLSSHCNLSEPLSPSSPKEDQPTPISVLEPPPSEEDKSGSDDFEKISAGLKDLRMQLRLLKLESADSDAEDLELFISSDEEDSGGKCHSPLSSGEVLQAFRDDEDRDFSYLLDVLIDSGVRYTSGNSLFNAYYPEEHPVGKEVFEKLEKKYRMMTSWSKSERKLLFDLISSILSDILTRMKSSCPSSEDLVEDVWQLVVKKRKELGGNQEQLLLDPWWLNLGDDVATIGKELETILVDDLMEELLSQII